MRDLAELAALIAPVRLRMIGMVSRVVVKLTTKTAWQLLGFDSPASKNVFNAEVFPGIGIYARPPANAKTEAIVLSVGADANTPAIVATRDEGTRQAVAGALKTDETAVYNSKAGVFVKNDATIEGRTKDGTAESLARNAALAQVMTAINNAIAHSPGAPSAPLALLKTELLALDATWPTGTTTLKGE